MYEISNKKIKPYITESIGDGLRGSTKGNGALYGGR